MLLDPALGEPTVLTATMKAFIAILQGDRAAAGVFLEECRAAPVSSKTAPALYIEGVYALLVLGDPICVAQLSHAREEFIAAGQSGDAHMATMFWAMAAVFLGNHADARFACDTYVAEAEAAGCRVGTHLGPVVHGSRRTAARRAVPRASAPVRRARTTARHR